MPRLPGIHHQDAVRALEKAGFRVIRQSKHIVMTNGERFITEELKIHEEIISGTINTILTKYEMKEPRGEFVLLWHPYVST